jgi:uncharacterized RDD family membrane protein YckC
MGGWVAQPQPVGVALPPGLQVAGMWRRFFAYILDNIIGSLLAIIVPIFWAIGIGAVKVNQAAIDQVEEGAVKPFAHVTEPILLVDVGQLTVAALLFAILEFVYFVVCWIRLRGGIGQKLLSLQVADAATGNNLTFAQATMRWLALYGLSAVGGVISAVVTFQVMATVPGSASMGGSSADALEAGSALASWNAISNLLSWVGILWALVLLVSTVTNPVRRGLHDRFGGSLVVGPAPVAAAWPGYAYPPQAYPPQGGAYPPQAYPPQGGYPQGGAYPQAGAGYPGSGGVPPAAPSAPSAQPPASPESRKPGS